MKTNLIFKWLKWTSNSFIDEGRFLNSGLEPIERLSIFIRNRLSENECSKFYQKPYFGYLCGFRKFKNLFAQNRRVIITVWIIYVCNGPHLFNRSALISALFYSQKESLAEFNKNLTIDDMSVEKIDFFR